MSKKKKGLGGMLPGGRKAAEVEAQKAEQKRREETQLRYQIERCKFELHCIELGLEEVAILHKDEASIQAVVTLRPFPQAQKQQRLDFINSKLNDLLVMAGEKQPEEKPASGLVGADGQELKKEEKPLEESEQEPS